MKKIMSAKDAYEYAKQFALEDEKRQRFILIYTKDDGTLIGWSERLGGAALAKIPQWMEIERAIIVTNHPSGSCVPDKYDVQETIAMKELLRANGIGLTDQIIVGCKEFYSYAEDKVTFTKR